MRKPENNVRTVGSGFDGGERGEVADQVRALGIVRDGQGGGPVIGCAGCAGCAGCV